jgi:hypothetical protein
MMVETLVNMESLVEKCLIRNRARQRKTDQIRSPCMRISVVRSGMKSDNFASAGDFPFGSLRLNLFNAG